MIKENFDKLCQRAAQACLKAGRDPKEITIVAVSKLRAPEEIIEAVKAGVVNIAENRVQEAGRKFNTVNLACSDRPVKWHLVGHLQTNKVKEAVKLFDLIHSVDSIKLAVEIDKEAGKISKLQDVLIQVNTSFEESKFGLRPDQVTEALLEAGKLKNIRIKGLMTIAPIADDPEKIRIYFRQLKQASDEANKLSFLPAPLTILSMGMSDDFETAIQEGSTMIRVGRAVFGE